MLAVSNSFKTSRHFAEAVVKVAADAAGCSAAELLLEAGIEPSRWQAAEWIEQPEVSKIWRTGERLSGRPEIGLDILREMQITDNGLLAMEFMSSRRFRDAISSLLQHSEMITNSVDYQLVENGDVSAVTISPAAGLAEYTHHSLDVNVATGVFWARTLLGRSSHDVLGVTFSHSGQGVTERYERILGCACRFNEAITSVQFAADTLDYRIATGDDRLHAASQQRIEKQLQTGGRWVDVIEQTLEGLLESEKRPTREQVAKLLGTSERSLLRRLEAEGTTFRFMVEAAIEQQAKTLLKAGESAERIAEALGYADSSTLARMLKRRTGLTVSELRRS